MLSRRGFSLIELLVALVVSGILATAIFQFVQLQGRFARLQTAREEVQQNARALVDIISSELRGVASGGIIAVDPSSVTFLSPVAWGTSCGDVGGATGVSFAPGQALPPIPSTRFRLARANPPAAPATVDVSDEGLDATRDACNARLDTSPAATPAEVRRYQGVAYPPFARVYLYEAVTYALGTVDGRTWILRNDVPFAGPVAAAPDGLRFVYRDSSGAVTNDPFLVSRVEVEVRTESRAMFNARPQENRVSTVVGLRNRF